MKIIEIPKSERPREKLIKRGADSLSSSELLAIILGEGVKNVNANELAFVLLNEVRSLKNFINLSYQELTKIKGIGPVKATKILAMVELGKRIFLEGDKEKIRLINSKDIYKFCKSFFYGLKQECFFCIYLVSKKKVLNSKMLFKGTMTRSNVHPREIFKEAYKVSASYIICAHNHPSGSVNPSPKDIEFTNYLIELGRIHGVLIYEHLIVSETKYYSFLENNLLD